MELPKLNYDDFYKFLISIGLILVVIAITIILFLINNFLVIEWIIATIAIIVLLIIGGSTIIIIWAGKKWHKNQTLLDKKLESEVKLIENEASQIIKPQGVIGRQSVMENISGQEARPIIALVSYKIAEVLPNSVPFDFMKDWKVWFWIANHDPKKYKAYVKIKFIFNGLKEGLSVSDGYYGGTRAWKLDAYSGIQAPGLEIPEEVKAVARKGKRIKIQINCEIKDEDDNLIENKFPQTYVYNSTENNWFLEP